MSDIVRVFGKAHTSSKLELVSSSLAHSSWLWSDTSSEVLVVQGGELRLTPRGNNLAFSTPDSKEQG
ncbi:hypothetical protein PoB_005148500 [Plakobranchus ocellatus]|uniref:Uncharacterized protein n=1 Tax=Plakobranchus ocellatus TaxID=259542 RepID=A0AAV4C075_9GAST|nr:hypothetical protein PoB_005148500 [Plakobranchus ocellatus]